MRGEGGARTSGASELRRGGIKYFICNHNNLGKEFFFCPPAVGQMLSFESKHVGWVACFSRFIPGK